MRYFKIIKDEEEFYFKTQEDVSTLQNQYDTLKVVSLALVDKPGLLIGSLPSVHEVSTRSYVIATGENIPEFPRSDYDYWESGGCYCPSCGSSNINAGHLDADGRSASSHVECDDCRAEWCDVYTLNGYEDLN